jgi:tetratricopeptide (TPR) repeat protein|tara:strand:- start:286 stop:1149 length:864 start_codon:yes stop_codon:yes gene_type:complete
MKRAFNFLLYSVFLLSVLVSACKSGGSEGSKIDPKKSNEHYLLAIEFAQYSLFQNSLDEFDLAIKYNPSDWKPYNKKGLIYFGTKNYTMAKEMFQKAAEINMSSTQILINLGMVEYMEGNKSSALSLWEKSVNLDLNDNDGKAFNNIGNIHKEEGELDKAIEYYEKAVSQERATLYINNLADVLRLVGRVDEAEKNLLESIKQDPKALLVHFNLAQVYKGQNKLDQALASYTKSLEVNPEFLEPYFESAQIYMTLSDKESAKTQLEKAIELGVSDPKFKELLDEIAA